MVRWAEPGDMSAVRALWQARFGDSDAFCDFFFAHRAKPETTVVFDEGGMISSALHVLPELVRVRTQALRAAMLCGVATDQAYEGQGRMGACLRFAMRAFARTNCTLLMQKPVDFDIYRNFGFAPVSDSAFFSLTPRELADDPSLFLPAYSVMDRTKIDAVSAICHRIYPAFCADYGTIGIRDADKQTLRCMDYFAEPGSLFYGTNELYAFTEPDQERLYLREAAWTDERAMQDIPALLASIQRRSGAQRLIGRLPTECAHLLPGCMIRPTGAAACINLSILLAGAFGDADFCACVLDPVIPENCGVWDFSGVRSDREPDFELDSAALVQLVFGYKSLAELAQENRAVLLTPACARFDARYPRRRCFTWDEY